MALGRIWTRVTFTRHQLVADLTLANMTQTGEQQWPRQQRSILPKKPTWAAHEQRSATAGDGSYLLELQYSDERELIGDLLRFGADVKVLAPFDLRNRMKRALHEAAGQYV